MARKPRRRSLAQIKQTENLTLQRTRSRSEDYLRIALADARTNIQQTNRLAKQAHNTAKREVRNARKRELRALRKTDSAITEVENLQAQVTELTATLETERQDAGRAAEASKERHSKATKKQRRLRERLSRVPSRLERVIQKAIEGQEQNSVDPGNGG